MKEVWRKIGQSRLIMVRNDPDQKMYNRLLSLWIWVRLLASRTCFANLNTQLNLQGRLADRNENPELKRLWAGEPRSVHRIQHLLKGYNPQIVFLIETKVDEV